MKRILSQEFEIHDLGEPRFLIGMEISLNRAEGTVTLSQKQYVRKILERHQMTESKPVVTPMDPTLSYLSGPTPKKTPDLATFMPWPLVPSCMPLSALGRI